MNYIFGVNDVNIKMKSATSDILNHMTIDYCAPNAQTIFDDKREAGSLRMNSPACAYYDTLGAVSTDWPKPMAVNHTAQHVRLQNLAECMPADHDDGSGQERQQSRGRSVLKDWSIPMAANPARTSSIPQAGASSLTGKSVCRCQHLNGIPAIPLARASSFTGKSEADQLIDACEPQLRGDCSSEFWKSNQNAKQEVSVDQFFGFEEGYKSISFIIQRF